MPAIPPAIPHVASFASVNAERASTPSATPVSGQVADAPVNHLPESAGDLEHALAANLFRALSRPLPVSARPVAAPRLQPPIQAAPGPGVARHRPTLARILDLVCGLVALGGTRLAGWPFWVSSLICGGVVAIIEFFARSTDLEDLQRAFRGPTPGEALASFEQCVEILQAGRYVPLPALVRIEQADHFSRSNHRLATELRAGCEKETHVLQALCRRYQTLLDDTAQHRDAMCELDYLQSLDTAMFIHNHGAAYFWALNVMLKKTPRGLDL